LKGLLIQLKPDGGKLLTWTSMGIAAIKFYLVAIVNMDFRKAHLFLKNPTIIIIVLLFVVVGGWVKKMKLKF